MEEISAWFWSTKFWLPANITWKHLEPSDDMNLPGVSGYKHAVIIAVAILLLRTFWHRFIAGPIGRRYGLKESKTRPPKPIPMLEKEYQQINALPDRSKIDGLSKQLDMSPRAIERWWRQRRAQEKPSKLDKFKEASFLFVLCTAVCIWGFTVCQNKPWLWNTRLWWEGYPRHHLPPDMQYYFLAQMGLYIAMNVCLITGHKRKDFILAVLHHSFGLFLYAISWITNLLRGELLITWLLDLGDPFVEAAKIMLMFGYHRLADITFVIFVAIFFVTRNIIFPFWVLRSWIFESYSIVGFSYIIFINSCLIGSLLVSLNIMWTYLIWKMIRGFLKEGQIKKDVRSDTEQELEEFSDERHDDTENCNGKQK